MLACSDTPKSVLCLKIQVNTNKVFSLLIENGSVILAWEQLFLAIKLWLDRQSYQRIPPPHPRLFFTTLKMDAQFIVIPLTEIQNSWSFAKVAQMAADLIVLAEILRIWPFACQYGTRRSRDVSRLEVILKLWRVWTWLETRCTFYFGAKQHIQPKTSPSRNRGYVWCRGDLPNQPFFDIFFI